jgi:hypothetical protein
LFYYFIVNEVSFRKVNQQNNCYKDYINFYVFFNILLNMCASSRYMNITCTLSINTEQGYVMRHIFYINLSCKPVTVVTFRQISSRNDFCHPHYLQYYTENKTPLVLYMIQSLFRSKIINSQHFFLNITKLFGQYISWY